MTTSLRALRRELFSGVSPFERSICKNCLAHLSQPRRARNASTATVSAESVAPSSTHIPGRSAPATATVSNPYHIKAGIVLSRPPLITRDLTPFEKAFFFYQRRLNERLALSFPRYFYYPEGTPGDTEWKRKMRDRRTPAKDIGDYNAYKKDSWNDELLVGSTDSEPEGHIENLLQDAVVEVEEQIEGQDDVVKRRIEVERPQPRVTEADRSGDMTSLTRSLQRTIYLVVQDKDGVWRFPETDLEERESLKRAAERLIVQAGGLNMNTWIVGNTPVGFHALRYEEPISKPGEELLGEKTFFMKGRIMAGQFVLKNSQMSLKAFKWLAKEELEQELDPMYYKSVRHMLVSQ